MSHSHGARRAASGGGWRAAAAVAMLSCSAEPGEGRRLGDDLGTFRVDALETANDCGAGALGSRARWAFEIDLARADSELFWDGRVGGQIRADLSFEFAARVDVEVRPGRGSLAPCAIAREDHISGLLEADAAGAPTAFTGEMRFGYAPAPGASCSAEDQTNAGLARLPCGMSYALDAERTRAPEP